ncbi:hypothetical protein ACFSYH_10670 [Populibacterium corticicola]|uniref:Uncharacterized protein n=1 Tax=Populibacterium corticicola TaxID=1812826 RepID=A0ABW5XIC3_9MICO
MQSVLLASDTDLLVTEEREGFAQFTVYRGLEFFMIEEHLDTFKDKLVEHPADVFWRVGVTVGEVLTHANTIVTR